MARSLWSFGLASAEAWGKLLEVRRLLSLTLLLTLGLPLLAAVFGSAQVEASLPMCCRRAGAHHCAAMSGAAMTGMAMTDSAMEAGQDRPVMRMACSAYPHSLGQVHTGGWTFEPVRAALYALPVTQAAIGQVEAGYRIAQGRARQKRGPPANHLS